MTTATLLIVEDDGILAANLMDIVNRLGYGMLGPVATGEEARANNQRSDVCAVPAAGVVAEAMVALVVADAVLEKFGGDSVTETRRNVEGYLAGLAIR